MFTQLRVAPECGLVKQWDGSFRGCFSQKFPGIYISPGQAAIVYRGGTLEAAVGAL